MDIPAPDTERDLHAALERWATDHATRFEDIGVSSYDPAMRPEQRLHTFKTEASEGVLSLSNDELHKTLKTHYDATLGDIGRLVLHELTRKRPQHSDTVESLVDSIVALLDQEQSIALLSPHADRLEDIGVISAALAVAFANASYIKRNSLILNKVMTRELYKGHPMVDMFKPFGNIYWVIPDTEATERWGVPARTKEYVNLNAMRSLLGDLRTGSVVTFAPTGSVMRRTFDDTGKLKTLHIPPIARASARLITRFDAYAVVVLWRDAVRISPLTRINVGSGDRTKATDALSQDVLATMSALTEEITDVPVILPGEGSFE